MPKRLACSRALISAPKLAVSGTEGKGRGRCCRRRVTTVSQTYGMGRSVHIIRADECQFGAAHYAELHLDAPGRSFGVKASFLFSYFPVVSMFRILPGLILYRARSTTPRVRVDKKANTIHTSNPADLWVYTKHGEQATRHASSTLAAQQGDALRSTAVSTAAHGLSQPCRMGRSIYNSIHYYQYTEQRCPYHLGTSIARHEPFHMGSIVWPPSPPARYTHAWTLRHR